MATHVGVFLHARLFFLFTHYIAALCFGLGKLKGSIRNGSYLLTTPLIST